MTLIVEDGSGIFEANSYAGFGFVGNYLKRRNESMDWDAATIAVKEAALIAATDYIDRRFGNRFKGQKKFLEMVVAASNVLEITTNSLNNDTVTIGSTTYKFTNTLSAAFDILIGADINETADNFIAAVNAGDGEGTKYGTGTTEHPDVKAESIETPNDVLIRAKVKGSDGNDIASTTTSDSDDLRWDSDTLTGGSDGIEQLLEWPRKNARSPAGVLYDEIPVKLRQATAEYALRAISGELMPDPVVDERGQAVTRKIEKVGPLEEHTHYWASQTELFKSYPEADKLLRDLVLPGRGVFR